MTRKIRSWMLAASASLAVIEGAGCGGDVGSADDGEATDGVGNVETGADADADAAPEAEPDAPPEAGPDADGDADGEADGDAPDGEDAADGDVDADGDAADDADAAPDGLMTLVRFDDAETRGLVCNDGTPAGYYIRRGSGGAGSRWLIHLEGGGFCHDAATCDQRAIDLPQFMTSTGWAETKPGDGAQSTSEWLNPDFHDANHVYLPFCSSDVWSGDRGASPETDGRHFRGGRIFRAVVDALRDPAATPAPNLDDADEVLLSGTSAGGIGVQANVDWLAAELGGAAVRGLNDAGWVPDLEPHDPTLVPFREQLQRGYAYWNAAVDASCAAANPGAQGGCYVGPHVYPEIAAPLFVQDSQGDLIILGFLGAVFPFDADEAAYAASYAVAVRASLDPVAAAFSNDTWIHGLLMGATFRLAAVDGVSFRDAVGNWFFGRPGPVKVILD